MIKIKINYNIKGQVGIVSYLLVNFWYTRLAANMASKSA
jgi:NADH-ubiquinone oxidoreductase chain 5